MIGFLCNRWRRHCCLLLLAISSFHDKRTAAAEEGEAPSTSTVRVQYGYFPEARPIHVACARGWFDYRREDNTNYQVACYPQTSGGFAASRLDSDQLDIANLGSTPLAQSLARGVDIQVFFIEQYKGDSQGIYVRDYIKTPKDLGRCEERDLKKCVIGVPFDSTMHYQVLFLLELFELTGKVDVKDMNIGQIKDAWDKEKIDAGACWGEARDHLLGHNAKILLTAETLNWWDRPTFGIVAANRKFIDKHPAFMTHFASVLSQLTDSFIDRFGLNDSQNKDRWSALPRVNASYVGSLTDVLMKSGEEGGSPSPQEVGRQREILDLFRQLRTAEQLSCDYLGEPGCSKPSNQHIETRDTAQFLWDQKVIASLGHLENMGNDMECKNQSTFCGGDSFNSEPLNNSVVEHVDYLNLSQLEATSQRLFAEYQIGRAEKGKDWAGDSTCQGHEVVPNGIASISDGASVRAGKSYSDNTTCTWEIRGPDCYSPSYPCADLVRLSFEKLRVWSGDFVRVYRDPSMKCEPTKSGELVLLAQLSGLYPLESSEPILPPFEADGCLLVEFETDVDQERSYGDEQNMGDGFLAYVDAGGGPLDCSGFPRSEKGLCECDGHHWGSDCSHTDYCMGTIRISLMNQNESRTLGSSGNTTGLDPKALYPNNLDCRFDIEVKGGNYVEIDINYDLEDTHDLLELRTGNSTSGNPYAALTGKSTARETYIIPVDAGFISMRLTTDRMGRRSGFFARVRQFKDADVSGTPCTDGRSGVNCGFAHCIVTNDLVDPINSFDTHENYLLGRVVSPVHAMPWAPHGGCTWPFKKPDGISNIAAIRIIFNSPLDLEPHPELADEKDRVIVRTMKTELEEFFIEECDSDEDCSSTWQVPNNSCIEKVGNKKGCAVKQMVTTIEFSDESEFEVVLQTDRNDLGRSYTVDFDVLLVKSCDSGSCESAEGRCDDGENCFCKGGVPCLCPCGIATRSVSNSRKVAKRLIGIFVPLVVVLLGFFWVYRRRKINKSRSIKKIIALKEAELETFRKSLVGMRTATSEYIPSVNAHDLECPEVVLWCWKETEYMMKNHSADYIAGNPADCWIKYDKESCSKLEKAYKETGKLGEFSPLPGYVVNFQTMKQKNQATGYERDVQRLVGSQANGAVDRDVAARLGKALPNEIRSEAQMVLVEGDVIQISSQRQDGWAFGTKIHHYDEALARKLQLIATNGLAGDDANVSVDTGWFELRVTKVPTGEELATLRTQVGDVGNLEPPPNWSSLANPSIVQNHLLSRDDAEYCAVVDAFMLTMGPLDSDQTVTIVSVERVQNLALWQSFIVKRRAICSSDDLMNSKRALERFERRWLWHGTNCDVMDKILQQGFNRSFCGKNATMYGKGVYFARDASYSARKKYSIPDHNNIQNILACRVVVGHYCEGRQDILTPDVRVHTTHTLYDSTVDKFDNPQIYVTFHDAQAYPEYLIKFRLGPKATLA